MIRRFCVVCIPFSSFSGGRLCHLGSDKLFSRSDEPHHCAVDSFLSRDSVVFSSGGIKPPLKPFVSGWRLIFVD